MPPTVRHMEQRPAVWYSAVRVTGGMTAGKCYHLSASCSQTSSQPAAPSFTPSAAAHPPPVWLTAGCCSARSPFGSELKSFLLSSAQEINLQEHRKWFFISQYQNREYLRLKSSDTFFTFKTFEWTNWNKQQMILWHVWSLEQDTVIFSFCFNQIHSKQTCVTVITGDDYLNVINTVEIIKYQI